MTETEEITSWPNRKKREKGRGKTILGWIVLAVVVVVLSWFGLRAIRNAPLAGAGKEGAAPQGPPPATVIVAKVRQDEVQERRRVTGTLRAVKRAEVAARESGTVLTVHVDEGSEVKEGKPIVSLDDRRINAELAEARAMLTGAEAVVTQRKAEAERAATDLQRKQKMFAQRAVSETEFLDAKRTSDVSGAQQKEAEDALKASESAVQLLEVRLEDMVVPAPFDGKVVARHVEPGEWLVPGDPVVTLVSTGTVEAWMNVPERFAGSVENAIEEWTVVADGSGISAPVKSMKQISDVDPTTRLMSLVIELDDQGGKLISGLSVHSEIPVSEPEFLLSVPVDAVSESFSGSHVFRASPNPDGEMPVAEKIPVDVRFRRDGRVYLSSSRLKPGDDVVTEGNERLFPMTPLIVSTGEEEKVNEESPELPAKP